MADLDPANTKTPAHVTVGSALACVQCFLLPPRAMDGVRWLYH
jgi:hypothetical protein